MKSFGVGLSIFFLLYPVARIEAETFSPPSDVPFGLMRSKAEKAGSDSPSSHFESVIEGEDFESFIAEHGIERSGRGASYLLLKAEEALSDNKDAEAIRLGEMAKIIAPDSPMPPFFLAKAYAYANPLNIANPISNFFVGLGRMMDDVFLLLSILSPFLLLLLPSVVLSLLTFTIFSITSYASVWIHQLTESSRGYLHPISALFLFVALIFLPLILGLPFWWFVYFSFLLFWRYYKRNEKGVVFSFLFVIGCSAWLLPFFITLYTVNAGPLFQEMSRNHKADHFWIPPKEPSNPSGWETWFISASREAKQGNHEKAAQLYQRALEQNPDSPMILNNLGNISFYQKEFDHAIAYYQAAIDLDASLISSHYNLSQTYRERLLFVKGEKIYSEAVAISPKTVDKYSKISARFPNFPVIEERIGSADLWRWFLREMDHRFYPSERVWKSWVGPFPLGQAPLLAGLSILLLVLATPLTTMVFSAKPCAFCKQAICKKCALRLYSYQTCRKCHTLYRTIQKKSDFKIIEDAVKKVPFKLYPFFLFPGGGHLAAGRTKLAFLLMILFYLFLTSFWIGEGFIPPTEWYLHRSGTFLRKALLVFLYLFAAYDLFRTRKNRVWL